MNISKTRISLALLSVLSSYANAESLQDIGKLALENDYKIELLENNFIIEIEKNYEVEGGFLPQINLNGGVNEGFFENGNNGRDYSNATTANLGVNLSYSIYDNTEDVLKKIQSKKALLSFQEYSKYKQELLYQVASVYYKILANKEILNVENENKKAVLKEYDKIKNMVEVGMRTTVDLAEIQADLDNAEASIVSAENNLQNSLTQLYLYTGKNELNPNDINFKDLKEDMEDIGYDYWFDLLKENNFDIKISKINKEISKDNIKLSQANNDMKVGFTSNISSDYNNRMEDEIEASANIGLTISMPIYTGGVNDSKTKQSQMNYVNSNVQLDYTYRQLEPKLKIIINELESMDRGIVALDKAVISSQKSLEAIKGSYEVGVRDIVDFLDANTQYYVSLKNKYNAQYDYLLKQYELLLIVGILHQNNL